MTKQISQTAANATQPSAAQDVLLRKCDCGNHTVAGGECKGCSKERMTVQRKSTGGGQLNEVPPIVHDVLRSPGQPLDTATRAFFEPRFGQNFSRVPVSATVSPMRSPLSIGRPGDHFEREADTMAAKVSRQSVPTGAHNLDFSGVRVHTDAKAAASARAVNALAYTVGSHVVFGEGKFAPSTAEGRHLLAHELTHVAQQGHQGEPVVRRWNFLQEIGGWFSGDDFSPEELNGYLTDIDTRNAIENHSDSDNKARAIVKQWNEDKGGFILTPKLKILLIQEMQSGFTGDDDEQAILILLRESTHAELAEIFGAAGVDPKDLYSDFHGSEEDELRAFYDQLFEDGAKGVLNGGRTLKPEALLKVATTYSWADLKAVITERVSRIEATLKGMPEDLRGEGSMTMARSDADDIYQQLQKAGSSRQAIKDIAEERVRQDTVLSDLNFKLGETSDPAVTKELKRRVLIQEAAILMLDLTLEPIYRDIAISAPKGSKAFGKVTTPLDAAQKKAAQEAIKPVTRAQVVSALGGTPPPPRKFVRQLPGENEKYEDKIAARVPVMINEKYQRYGAPRSEKEHSDKSKTHDLTELESVAKASAAETDLVFGNFKRGDPFTADKFDTKGRLTKKGNIHDAWQSEQAQLKADPSYKERSAKFWMFWLLQNDDEIAAINYKHDATPMFDEHYKPLKDNDEAKLVGPIGNKHVKDDAQRLFEIGRGWDAFNVGHEVSVQLFKNPNSRADRVFLWDMFFTLIHEYLHSLADSKYNRYAEKKGGEATTEGNTLIEGVDSLLTETVWANAKPRASRDEVRKAVEPDAVKANEPFDSDLLPQMPHRRYPTYPNAVKLAGIVGINNLYAAYFYGDIRLIGGK